MIILEVAFLLVNLAVPYWIWTSRSASPQPQIEQEAFKKNLYRLSQTAGGFGPCDDTQMTEILDDLCEKSRLKWTAKQSVVFERAGNGIVFSCLVEKDEVKVRWFGEISKTEDLKCQPSRTEVLKFSPSFAFNLKGQLRSIEFTAHNQARQVAPMTNCRLKVSHAQNVPIGKRNKEEFLTDLGELPGDAKDWPTENAVCLRFDPHPGWDALRQHFRL